MKKMRMVPVLTGILICAVISISGLSCSMDNKASDYGLYPDDFYGKVTSIVGLNSAVGGKNTITVHACCEQQPAQGNNGPAPWAADGIITQWWSSCTVPGEGGYSVATDSDGHLGDTGNYLMKGDSTHYDGYTWTQDPSLAVGGTADPWTVADAVPASGAHWITLDLGREVQIGAGTTGVIGYYFRSATDAGGFGVNGNSYQIYASKFDFGWIVDGQAGITLLDSGTLTGAAGNYVYIYITPQDSVSFRYLQLRWILGSTKTATATNITFRTIGTTLDYSYLTAVYIQGKKVIRTLSPDSLNYNYLQTALGAADKNGFPAPKPEDIDTTPKLYAQQQAINALADNILTLLYKINPPKKPPEVLL